MGSEWRKSPWKGPVFGPPLGGHNLPEPEQGISLVRGQHLQEVQLWPSCVILESKRPHTSTKENHVWIWRPYPDWDSGSGLRCGLLLKFNWDLSKDTRVLNVNENQITVSRDISQIVEKRPFLQCRRIDPLKICGSGGERLLTFNQFTDKRLW